MIKRCAKCHGKGERTLITRMTFDGPDSEMETQTFRCEDCNGEGQVYICPASKAPVGIEP